MKRQIHSPLAKEAGRRDQGRDRPYLNANDSAIEHSQTPLCFKFAFMCSDDSIEFLRGSRCPLFAAKARFVFRPRLVEKISMLDTLSLCQILCNMSNVGQISILQLHT